MPLTALKVTGYSFVNNKLNGVQATHPAARARWGVMGTKLLHFCSRVDKVVSLHTKSTGANDLAPSPYRCGIRRAPTYGWKD